MPPRPAGQGFGIHSSQLAAMKILMDELSTDQEDQLWLSSNVSKA